MILQRICVASALCVVWLSAGGAFAADAPQDSAAAADQKTLLQGRALYTAGRLAEAEPLLRRVLAAIDAGSMDADQAGQCLGPLLEIYRTWGRNEDALVAAHRFEKFLRDQSHLDPKVRDRQLEDNDEKLAEILSSLGRYDEAQAALADALRLEQARADADPIRRLALECRLARLADSRSDPEAAQKRWSQVAADGETLLTQYPTGKDHARYLPGCAAALTLAYESLENLPAAIRVNRQLLELQTAQKDFAAYRATQAQIGKLLAANRQFAEAQATLSEALSEAEKSVPGSMAEAELRSRLAEVLQAQGHLPEAKRHWQAAAAIYTKALAKAERADNNAAAVMTLLAQLESVAQQMGQLQDAIAAGKRLLELREKRLGGDHPLVWAARSDLGALYGAVQYFEQAKPLLAGALDYWRRHNPPAPAQLARALNDLGVVQRATGSFSEAQKLFEESLAIRRRALRPDDMRLAYSLNNLASVLLDKGDYAAAVALFDQAAAIYRGRGRMAEDALSNTLLNIAMAYKSQGQFDKASDYCGQALTLYEHVFGPDAPGAISFDTALASLAIAANHLDQAAEFNGRAWKLCETSNLTGEPIAATVLHHRATLAYLRGEMDAASRDWRQALAIQQAAGQTAAAARTLNYLAKIDSHRGEPDAAEARYREALAMQRSMQAYPTVHYLTLCNLAEILHGEGKTDESLVMLQEAVKLVEAPRTGTVGAEEQRAEYFAQFASAFDLLVAWNLKAGRIEPAFDAAERGRNRTFLDQLGLAGVDLRDTLTGPEAKPLLDRERELRTRLGTLRAKVLAAGSKSDSDRALAELGKQLSATQDEFAAVWTDIRNASPFYRQQLARGTPIGSLAAVRRQMGQSKGLMLFYYLGSKESSLLVIGGEQTPVEVVPLVIPQALADGLHVAAGPLTRPIAVQIVSQYLADLRDRAGGRGLGGIVHSPKGVRGAEQGTILAEVLLPRAVRKMVEDRAASWITIVPDGALHQLPFEALLLEGGDSPRYLLDVFPPIAYAPSATILLNLLERGGGDSKSPGSLLTVGNPHYPQGDPKSLPVVDKKPRPADAEKPPTLAAVSRDAYVALGGRLPLLPGTAQECARVAGAFPADRVARLEWDDATEVNVRRQIAGRRYVHLAAHGLVDQQHDNLFGAIALTPGRGANQSSDDDGFLSLHEIHTLPLTGCELVVLSACETNVGPDRPLEAGSTLAQAFLAAGARRVVCSHWNVDDASTAQMMGQFFESLAKADRDHSPANFAAALQAARKSVRANPDWSSPYYWAPFVLIGPGE